MMIINPNNSKVNVLFLFFINLVNLIINNVIIPQYASGKIGRVNTPIMLIRVVSILKSVTIKNPKNAANRNRNSIRLSLINTAINLDEIKVFGFIGNGNICSISPAK